LFAARIWLMRSQPAITSHRRDQVTMRLLPLVCLLLFVSTTLGSQANAQEAMEPLDRTVCGLIERSARTAGLPVGFLTRIIWRESSFRPHVVSPAGAQGIAQFMPGTARERGLADPFDPEQAIPKAAHFLAELKQTFGNLGLAAAAYNAGSARVSAWLAGQGELPRETRLYVLLVTEIAAEGWTGRGTGRSVDPGPEGGDKRSCLEIATALRVDDRAREEFGDGGTLWAPWGVQLAGNFSKALALASFERARQRYARLIGDMQPMVIGRLLRSRGTRRFYQVRLPAETRQFAQLLCQRIQAIGGACVAMRS
jgi:hypothetical protein